VNFPLFVSKRLALGDKKSFSRFIIAIAIAAIALSVAVMIVSTCMVTGFSKEIKERIFGFWGEIHITGFDNNESLESTPIKKEQVLLDPLRKSKEVRNVAPFIVKAGILKTKTEIEGIALKGVDASYDWKTIDGYLTGGRLPNVGDSVASKDILLSRSTARKLRLKPGDNVIAYFIRSDLSSPLGRRLHVSGIYHTGLEEYDKQFALVDIRVLRELNQWHEDEVAGYEVRLKDMNKMDAFKDSVYMKYVDQTVNAQTMKDINRNIFEWLDLQTVNEYLILGFMILVAVLNMITALIILILDRTNMIGILKSMGAGNSVISKIFIYNAAYIILNGLFWGNLIGLGICLLQHYTGFIQLNEENYYLSVAPVYFNVAGIVLINVGTLVICTCILLLPVKLISRITPVRAIRFK
jgi:lipoprotein-releasing system permease protein